MSRSSSAYQKCNINNKRRVNMPKTILLLLTSLEALIVSALSLRPIICQRPRIAFVGEGRESCLSFSSSDILDVEFEPVNPEDMAPEKTNQPSILQSLGGENSNSLIDLAIEADPEFTSNRIPFLDYGAGMPVRATEGRTTLTCNWHSWQISMVCSTASVCHRIPSLR